MGWTRLVFVFEAFIFFIVIYVTFYIAVIVSSFLAAHNKTSHTLNRSQKWYFYILFFVSTGFINSVILEHRGALFGYEQFSIPAGAMIPTLMIGDFIMVDTWAYNNMEPEIGDVIVFDYPKDPTIPYVKKTNRNEW